MKWNKTKKRETEMSENNTCSDCKTKELETLRAELSQCKGNGKIKDRKIKVLDKKVFILTIIAVGIGAIFGKEALDSITEWLGSISNFRSSADNLTGHIVPAPGTLGVFAIALLMSKPRRRRK
jgi:hypothetical protein